MKSGGPEFLGLATVGIDRPPKISSIPPDYLSDPPLSEGVTPHLRVESPTLINNYTISKRIKNTFIGNINVIRPIITIFKIYFLIF